MNSAQNMTRVMIQAHGGTEALHFESAPIPEPGSGEVIVQLKTMALNHLDLWVRRGVEGHRFPLPLTPGCDGAGIVTSVGSGVDTSLLKQSVMLSPGFSCGECAFCESNRDPLCKHYGILGETCHGTCAEYVRVQASQCLPKPDSASWEEAAAFSLSTLTSASMIEKACLESGETLLVIAGTSGVGSMAIQIGKKLGCQVIATGSTEEKRQKARGLGADHVLDPELESWWKEVKSITSGRGADVIFENVGQATWNQSLLALAIGGRLTTCGATTGSLVPVELKRLFFKNQQIIGSTMGSRHQLSTLLKSFDSRELVPLIDSVYPFRQMAEAHDRMESRQSMGKIVLQF
ncbi:MAG: zinc-binding dehydrogenase [Planctomycetes bacterium]|nr:zinc-binding dehydrogenase [Planctomycetota bacterium]